jgi:hypothetical protein
MCFSFHDLHANPSLPPHWQAAPLVIFAWYVVVQRATLDAATAFTTLAWIGQIGWSINSLPGAFNAIGMLLPSMTRLARQLDAGWAQDATARHAERKAAGVPVPPVTAGGGDTVGGGRAAPRSTAAGTGRRAGNRLDRQDLGRQDLGRQDLGAPLMPAAATGSCSVEGGEGGSVAPLTLSAALPPGVVALLDRAILCGAESEPRAAGAGGEDGTGAMDGAGGRGEVAVGAAGGDADQGGGGGGGKVFAPVSIQIEAGAFQKSRGARHTLARGPHRAHAAHGQNNNSTWPRPRRLESEWWLVQNSTDVVGCWACTFEWARLACFAYKWLTWPRRRASSPRLTPRAITL